MIYGGEAKDKLIGAFIKLFLAAFLYNLFSEKITGRKSAFSPIDIAVDSINTTLNEKLNSYDKFKTIGIELIGNTPFFGGLFGGGRLPISAAIPNVGTTGKSIFDLFDNEIEDKTSAIKNLKSELMKPVYYVVLPFAGGQIKKTIEGLGMYNNDKPVAGSYANNGRLRFTVEDDNWTKIQAAIFGQYASKEAKEYFNSGNKTLTKEELSELLDLDMNSSEYREYKTGLKEAKKTEDSNGYIKYYDGKRNVYWYNEKNGVLYDSNYKESDKSIGELDKESATEAIFDYIDSLNVNTETKNKMINEAVSRNKDSNGYSKYTDSNGNKYWYDEDNQILYDDEYNKTNKSLSALTKSTIDISTYGDYESLEEYDYATKNAEKYNLIKQIDSFDKYQSYQKDIDDISEKYSEIDTDSLTSKQKTALSKQKKEEVFDYINELNLNKAQKIMLFKSIGGYSIKDYKSSMFEYIDNLDITRAEKEELWNQLY